MTDTAHLSALRVRLSHERGRLAAAKKETERQLRRVWIAQLEREIEEEKRFLGLDESEQAGAVDLSDEELLAELRQ